MKIIVSIKQVPARDSALRINAEGNWLDESDLSYEMNEPDAYALEEGLQIREKLGGEVVVLCAGPAQAGQTIREALAKGADRAVHVQLPEAAAQPDALTTARFLAEAIRSENADIVLTGLQSDDMGFGQTGVIMAELLGFAHATIVLDVEVNDSAVRVKRELEDGWFQHVTLPLPAVLTVQSGIKKLRYATLMGIKKAKTREVRVVTVPAFDEDGSTDSRQVYTPSRSKAIQLFSGDAHQAAKQLVEKLKFEARVL